MAYVSLTFIVFLFFELPNLVKPRKAQPLLQTHLGSKNPFVSKTSPVSGSWYNFSCVHAIQEP